MMTFRNKTHLFSINLVLSILVLAYALPARAAEEKFDEFWTKFKAAIQRNDKNAIAEMTKFPYLLQGNFLNKAQFIKSYGTIFDASTRKSLVKQKPLKDKDCYMVFCGEEIFIFAKVGGRYLFTEIGAND